MMIMGSPILNQERAQFLAILSPDRLGETTSQRDMGQMLNDGRPTPQMIIHLNMDDHIYAFERFNIMESHGLVSSKS
jgi:hypothetical protein